MQRKICDNCFVRSVYFVNLISKQFMQCILFLVLNYTYKKLLKHLKIILTTFIEFRHLFCALSLLVNLE